MPLYFGGGQSPTSSPTQGPLVDSVRQLTFTDSRGQTSGYSIWAAHIDPDEPVGMLVHLHGDGGYEYKNDPDSWYLTGPTGILTLAQARNMILVVPFTPDREIDEINTETWWEDIVPHVGWAMELTREILDTYSVDLGRVWFSGFSGGAEAISHQVIPHHLNEIGAHAGGFVILGGGASPYEVTQTVISSPLKARFPITWVVGENDRPEFAYDEYDGRGHAEEGEVAYRAYGWVTDIVIVSGKQHLLVDGSQGLYGHYIGQAMDAAPVISYTPGIVTELYLGDRRCELYLGDQPVQAWASVDPPLRVTLETDTVGWFPTAPTHPLVAGVNEWAEISFTTDVWANKPMRDYEAEVTYPARSVIPAGSWLFVPDTHIPVKVTITEHVPEFPPQPVSVGLAGPHDWEEYTLAEYQGVLADMTSMGMKRIRISALWDRIESTKGTYWWDQIDMLVNTAVAAGIQPLVVLMGVPSWARPDFETASKGFRPEWEAFCTAVATRYAGVVPAYEIWNEPNLDRFWLGGNVSNFHDVLSRAVTKIKAADPNALVISGGLAPAVNSTDTTEPLDFIGALYAQNALQGVDGIGWHPYSFPEMPSGVSEWNTFRKMDDLKDLIVDNGHEAQIWITEIGAPTGGDVGVGEAAQATIIDDGLNLAAEDPLMGPVFVYTHKDLHLGEGDMESWFGIYTSTGVPKPAVATIQAITAARNT